ncbi:MAG: amidohydrolase [Alphaproteobacteria bacterium]|nr:amidohydrolase [Alphaproteobacteria bacterium]
MLIVDAQVHVWAASTPERPWPARSAPHRAPLGKDELLREMDKAGVDRAVLVPPSWEGDRNDLAIAAAEAHPDRFAVMGRFDPDAAGARDQLAGWRRQPGMLGMRLTFHTELLRQPLLDGRFDWLWGAAERAGIPLMVLVHHGYAHLIDAVAARHPGLRLVMDHLGLNSTLKDDAAFRDLDKMLALAKRPNVAAKASALPCYTSDVYPYRWLHPYVRRVYDAFGPKRMFWGTDLSRLPCTYRQGITMFTEEMPWLSSGDKDWIMGRGLCDWLGWKV